MLTVENKNNIELSVIIVNYNAGELLHECLRSIYKNIKNIKFEVYVIDNNSGDNSLKLAKSEFKRINVIENKKNLGFSRANNQAIKISKGGYVLLLNPDTLIDNGALDAMVKFMDIHQDIGVIGPKIFDSDGKIQLSCRSLPTLKTAFFSRYSLLTKLFPNNRLSRKYLLSDLDHGKTQEVDWVSGSCMMIRRKVFEDIGLMDENFFMYCEDVDFCYRAKLGGWKVFYFPDARIVHHIGGSSKSFRCRAIVEHHRSMLIFYRKHFHRNFILDIAVLNGIILRMCICILKARLIKK